MGQSMEQSALGVCGQRGPDLEVRGRFLAKATLGRSLEPRREEKGGPHRGGSKAGASGALSALLTGWWGLGPGREAVGQELAGGGV